MPQTGLFFVTRARTPPGEPRDATWLLPGVNKPVNWSWQARVTAGCRALGFGECRLVAGPRTGRPERSLADCFLLFTAFWALDRCE